MGVIGELLGGLSLILLQELLHFVEGIGSLELLVDGPELPGDLPIVLDVGNGHAGETRSLVKAIAKGEHSMDEMMTGDEVDADLEDKEEDSLGDLGVELLGGAEDGAAVLGVHGGGQDAVNDHEDDDEQLQDAEVGLPEGATVGVVLEQEGLEEEDDAEKGQEHVGSREVHEI